MNSRRYCHPVGQLKKTALSVAITSALAIATPYANGAGEFSLGNDAAGRPRVMVPAGFGKDYAVQLDKPSFSELTGFLNKVIPIELNEMPKTGGTVSSSSQQRIQQLTNLKKRISDYGSKADLAKKTAQGTIAQDALKLGLCIDSSVASRDIGAGDTKHLQKSPVITASDALSGFSLDELKPKSGVFTWDQEEDEAKKNYWVPVLQVKPTTGDKKPLEEQDLKSLRNDVKTEFEKSTYTKNSAVVLPADDILHALGLSTDHNESTNAFVLGKAGGNAVEAPKLWKPDDKFGVNVNFETDQMQMQHDGSAMSPLGNVVHKSATAAQPAGELIVMEGVQRFHTELGEGAPLKHVQLEPNATLAISQDVKPAVSANKAGDDGNSSAPAGNDSGVVSTQMLYVGQGAVMTGYKRTADDGTYITDQNIDVTVKFVPSAAGKTDTSVVIDGGTLRMDTPDNSDHLHNFTMESGNFHGEVHMHMADAADGGKKSKVVLKSGIVEKGSRFVTGAESAAITTAEYGSVELHSPVFYSDRLLNRAVFQHFDVTVVENGQPVFYANDQGDNPETNKIEGSLTFKKNAGFTVKNLSEDVKVPISVEGTVILAEGEHPIVVGELDTDSEDKPTTRQRIIELRKKEKASDKRTMKISLILANKFESETVKKKMGTFHVSKSDSLVMKASPTNDQPLPFTLDDGQGNKTPKNIYTVTLEPKSQQDVIETAKARGLSDNDANMLGAMLETALVEDKEQSDSATATKNKREQLYDRIMEASLKSNQALRDFAVGQKAGLYASGAVVRNAQEFSNLSVRSHMRHLDVLTAKGAGNPMMAAGDMFSEGSFWGSYFYGDGSMKSTMDTGAGFKNKIDGGVIGIDASLCDEANMGLSFTYGKSSVKEKDQGTGKLDGDTYMGSVYGNWFYEDVFVSGVIGYGRGSHTEKRSAPSLSDDGDQRDYYKGDAKSSLWSASFQGGYNWTVDDWLIQPKLAANLARLSFDDVKEKGGENSYKLKVKDYTITEGGLGVRAVGSFDIEDGALQTEVNLMYFHDFSSSDYKGTGIITNISSPVPFDYSVSREKNRYHAGVGLTYVMDNNVRLGVTYDYDWVGDYKQYAVGARFSYLF
ncbi:hypothetical protein CI610_00525 [invertebrate metagenome]|uniref:Autotransporter domain-containing protein n=1 Tax=invertebrate metagenome TaxID=1711999 RepID=A0A2H9TBD4_9ZZZZ